MKTAALLLAFAACSSAAILKIRPVAGSYDGAYDGRYVQDNSGAYNANDGRYIPDNSGSYVHSDAGYKHDAQGYRHQADKFGGNGGNGNGYNGAGNNGNNGGFGGAYVDRNPAHGAGNAAHGAGNVAHGAGNAAHGVAVGLKQGNAAGLYDNRNYGIIRQTEEVLPDGYHYLYETENKILAEEQGKLERQGSQDEAMNSAGFFEYTGPDAVVYRVDYTANEDGFVPTAAHLPTPPPIPALILKSLEYQRAAGTL
ncbi:unnamed protein product [Brassicogethes aeneus]|uniref:Uncharacterized protein n=1 Tax=Brassicogethes aeneus TaxID=1431903 RepID=A0A9P0B8Y3_BRAAE|nr:unnamed protein product [Brassicogethes aeneus]